MSMERYTPRRVATAIYRRFLDRIYPVNAFMGVYESFEEAREAAPATKPLGYDDARSEDWYASKFREVLAEDYPVLFWLRTALLESRRVWEIGGHVGEAFYAFSRLIDYPAELHWTILDVPSIAKAGAALAAERNETRLHFTAAYEDVTRADIVLAAGALQYIDTPTLSETIAGMEALPRHILINVTPVWDGPSFVTLQNIGSVYCPYRIFNRSELLVSLTALGYQLIDEWRKDRMLRIRAHADKRFDHYSGFYLRR